MHWLFLLSAFVAVPALAEEFRGRVIAIVDGDTIDVLASDKKQCRVRLHGIDAPERGQPFSTKSKDYLGSLAFGKDVQISAEPGDRYGRVIGRVSSGDEDLNLAMLRAGMAWHYTKYDQSAEYAAAEKSARDSRAGLWKDKRAIPPWDWRKMPKAERESVRKAVADEVEK